MTSRLESNYLLVEAIYSAKGNLCNSIFCSVTNWGGRRNFLVYRNDPPKWGFADLKWQGNFWKAIETQSKLWAENERSILSRLWLFIPKKNKSKEAKSLGLDLGDQSPVFVPVINAGNWFQSSMELSWKPSRVLAISKEKNLGISK